MHNAVLRDSYPNMPTWISVGVVFGTLIGILSIGVLGYLLSNTEHRSVGFALLGIYATLGFGGFAHYALAPPNAHTWPMNLTIWLEAGTAGLLLFVVIRLFAVEAGGNT